MLRKLVCAVFLGALPLSALGGAGAAASREDITAAVDAGAYPQITNVIAARGGRVFYEHCFGSEGAAALRNTRSATKTVNGVLVEAAVDSGLLRVDSPAQPYFKDRWPLAIPDVCKSH